MNITPLFSVPLGITNLDRKFTAEEMSLFLNELNSVSPNIGNSTSVNKQVLDHPTLSTLKEEILIGLNKFVQEVNPPMIDKNIEFYITQSWLNINHTDEWHHPHIHTNSVISGVLYINVKDKVDSCTFARKEGLFGNLVYLPKKETAFNTFFNKIPVSNGTLLFFPSITEHHVSFNKGTHKRISLSFNVFLTGALGSDDTTSKLDL
jgi:uncharacterized protein (TIGR02466 family)